MVVSPDGSGEIDGDTKFAFEIKCPVPGKVFQTDVHYRVTKYYVGQALSEMAVLKCNLLLYTCYTPESTTVHMMQFDPELWNVMFDVSYELLGGDNPVRPKKKHEKVAQIQMKIEKFLETNVTFIGEFKSVKAVSCSCSISDLPGEIHQNVHHLTNRTSDEENDMKTHDAVLLLRKAESCIEEAYNLTRIVTKEVIVVMISDMDIPCDTHRIWTSWVQFYQSNCPYGLEWSFRGLPEKRVAHRNHFIRWTVLQKCSP